MTHEMLLVVARGAVDRHLGDLDPDADSLYDEIFTLAHDALSDVGADLKQCIEIAQELALSMTQP